MEKMFEKMYLITIPAKEKTDQPYQFVTDDLSKVTGKYPFMMIQQIDVV